MIVVAMVGCCGAIVGSRLFLGLWAAKGGKDGCGGDDGGGEMAAAKWRRQSGGELASGKRRAMLADFRHLRLFGARFTLRNTQLRHFYRL